MNDSIPFITAADCARQIGITVKALRVYEDRGLLSPPRSEKNWRLYGAREISRLNEILTFKAMGFSLSDITELLSGHESTTDNMLTLQQTCLTEQRRRLDISLGLVTALREKAARCEVLSVADLVNLAKEMQMSDIPNNDIAWKRYEQMRPRVEIDSDPNLLADYVGYYRLSDEAVIEITLEDNSLFLRMSGQMRVQ
ncbi:MAG: MerR family transcriptional regulator, partial [Pseudomonadota bacterium]